MTLFNPATTAAVHIDMQGAVLTHATGPIDAATVVSRAATLAEDLRRAGGLNIFVRTSFLPDESDKPHPVLDIQRPTPKRHQGWDMLLPEMNRQPNEPVVVKRTFNAFYASDLDLQLRRHGIETILLTGIQTNFGVEGTGRSAYDRGYHIIFVTDVMASAKAENHEFAVQEIFPQLGQLRGLQSVSAMLRTSQ